MPLRLVCCLPCFYCGRKACSVSRSNARHNSMESLSVFWAIYSNVIMSLGINGLLALSIWLTLACGVLSIANAAFMGIGAYTASLLTMKVGTPFIVSLAAGMAMPAVAALIIGLPVIRLSGIYLAMATLAFGEVIRVVILNTESLTG